MMGAMRRVAPLLMMTAMAVHPPSGSAQEPPARSRAEQHAIAEMITRCSDDQRQLFAIGLSRTQYLLFCNCYVYSSLDAIDADEEAYRREHDAPSPKFVETSRALVPACVEQARLRAPH
jgi:hypothetical protein